MQAENADFCIVCDFAHARPIMLQHSTSIALVALKLLVSLISRLVTCSARIVVDRQTERQTHRQVL